MLKQLFLKIKKYWSQERCYTQREYEGIAAMGCCCGLTGGDSSTGYLQYSCIDCPHYVFVD